MQFSGHEITRFADKHDLNHLVLLSQPKNEKRLKITKQRLDKVVESDRVDFDIANLQGSSSKICFSAYRNFYRTLKISMPLIDTDIRETEKSRTYAVLE